MNKEIKMSYREFCGLHKAWDTLNNVLENCSADEKITQIKDLRHSLKSLSSINRKYKKAKEVKP